MTQFPAVHASAAISDGCQITHRVNCAGDVTITVGLLQLTFQPEVLAELLSKGAEALGELEARYAAIRAEANGSAPGAPLVASVAAWNRVS